MDSSLLCEEASKIPLPTKDEVKDFKVNSEQRQVKRVAKGILPMGIILFSYFVISFIFSAVLESERPLNEKLFDAVEHGSREQVNDLLNKGADPNFIYAPRPLLSKQMRCPVIQVARNVEIAQILLDHGARINATDIDGKTALYYAIRFHNTPLIRFLQEHGGHE